MDTLNELRADLREAGGDIVASHIASTGRAPAFLADGIALVDDACYLDCVAREHGLVGMPCDTGAAEWLAVYEGVRDALEAADEQGTTR